MQKNVRGWKVVSVLAMGSLLQLFGGGCLETLPKNIWTGFGLGLGNIPAVYVYDNFIAPLIGDDGEEAAE